MVVLYDTPVHVSILATKTLQILCGFELGTGASAASNTVEL
jgi:hypothetical protein